MLKMIYPLMALLCSEVGQAQTPWHGDSLVVHPGMKLAYLSTLIYPGISTGIEFPLLHFDERLASKQKHSDYVRRRFIAGNLSWYHHPGFHDNLYITAEWEMRRTLNKGIVLELSLGPGFSRTFLGGTTYKVNENGSISVIKLAGFNYAMIKAGGGIGYDYSQKRFPVSAIVTLSIITMFPYNSTVYFRPVLEFGIISQFRLRKR